MVIQLFRTARLAGRRRMNHSMIRDTDLCCRLMVRMRRTWIASLALLLSVTVTCPRNVAARDILASVIFGPGEVDPSPQLNGIIKINLETGTASPFIPLGTANLFFPTDLVVGPNGNLYVSTLFGTVLAFDPHTGIPLPSSIPSGSGGFDGLFAFTNGSGNALEFGPDGNLYVATSMGDIAKYNATTGAFIENVVTGLTSPDVITFTPSGALIYDTGEIGAPGAVLKKTGGSVETLIPPGSPGFGGASHVLLTPAGNSPTRMLVSDFHGNKIHSYAIDGSDQQLFAVVPPAIPDPLPPGITPENASNFPSEMLLLPNNTVLVGNLGLTRRPDNRGSILEFALNGTLTRTVADGLPPISGITRTFALGDLNQDELVDGADVSLVFQYWNTAGVGDLDRSGTIDGADIAIVYSNWTGDTFPTAPVPEPHSFVGTVLVAGLLTRRVIR